MRRVDGEGLEAVGALRNVIGCPASAKVERRENEGGKKMHYSKST
jgi:hypothetical protein